MARIAWTRRALNHLREILDYTAENFSPLHAEKLAAKFDLVVERIANSPRLGTTVPEFQQDELREWLVKPFRVICQVDDVSAVIVAIVHHGRDLSTMYDPSQLEP